MKIKDAFKGGFGGCFGVLGVIIVIIILVAIFSSKGGKKPTTTPEQTTQPTKTETKTFSIGEQVKLGDYILIVHSVESCIPKGEFAMKPESGKKFIVADVSQENVSSTPRDYNLWDFTLQDDKNYSYQTTLADCKEPNFSSGTLQPGMKTRGYVTFQIPEANQPSKLIFTPSWLSAEQIIVNVKK